MADRRFPCGTIENLLPAARDREALRRDKRIITAVYAECPGRDDTAVRIVDILTST